jgi:isocitrate/isopropylmalate dehydrogenase
MTETMRVAYIPGDGIGAEVVAEARHVLDAVAKMRVISSADVAYTTAIASISTFIPAGRPT